MKANRILAMSRWSKIKSSKLVKNAFSLYAVQMANYVFPLITLPFLAKTLGLREWGVLAFSQSFSAYLLIVVEYGFYWSGTREISRHRESRQDLQRIFGGITAAKILLSCGCIIASVIVIPLLPILRQRLLLSIFTVVLAIAQGASLLWFFQGLEDVSFAARVDVGTKAATTLAILAVVKVPTDSWKVMALQAAAAIISYLVMWRRVGGHITAVRPQFAEALSSLYNGRTMFLFRASMTLYASGNAFLLGLFVPPIYVGYYAAAEKISRAANNVLTPISQVLYARFSHLASRSAGRARALLQTVTLGMTLVSSCISAILFFGAPFLIRVLLGAGFAPAITCLRWLSLLPLLLSWSNIFGIQWMLPHKRDKAFNAIVMMAGLVNLCFVALLARSLMHVGMAISVVSSEFFVTACMFVYVMREDTTLLRFDFNQLRSMWLSFGIEVPQNHANDN